MTVAPSAFYLPEAHVPEIFLEADRQYIEEHKNDPKPVTKTVKVPMPFIHGVKGAKQPIIVTEDWALKKKRKQLKRRSEDLKEMQIEMMQLICKRDRLRRKLAELDPANKKDARRIVSYNVQLKDIDADLSMLQEQSGINLNELDHGTRLARFIGGIKRWWKRKVVKKAKKFFRENKELIVGMCSIIIPVLLSTLVKIIIA